MDKNVAQMRIAREMREAEKALDDALVRQSSLLTAMVTARRETGVAPFTGQGALMRLVRSQQTLLSASGDIARVHGELLKVQESVTGFDKCPPNEPMAFNDESDNRAA